MRSGLIDIRFEFPDQEDQEQGALPSISLNAADLIDSIEDADKPGLHSLLARQREARVDFSLPELLDGFLAGWHEDDKPVVCEELASYFEGLAAMLRRHGSHLSKDLRPRWSGPKPN